MLTFSDILLKAQTLDSLVYAVESALLEADLDASNGHIQRVFDLFYILVDNVADIKAALAELEGHKLVCDAIQMVNNVTDLQAENKALKEYIEQLST